MSSAQNQAISLANDYKMAFLHRIEGGSGALMQLGAVMKVLMRQAFENDIATGQAMAMNMAPELGAEAAQQTDVS